jgi:hypothetical protein
VAQSLPRDLPELFLRIEAAHELSCQLLKFPLRLATAAALCGLRLVVAVAGDGFDGSAE